MNVKIALMPEVFNHFSTIFSLTDDKRTTWMAITNYDRQPQMSITLSDCEYGSSFFDFDGS